MTRPIHLLCLGLATLALITSCGGSSDSSTNVIADPPAPPQDGLSGRVASGIAGASLSVWDANGEEIVLASGRTTGSNGGFSVVFSEFAIDAGITPPLMIMLNGTGATAICDYNEEGDNDCLSADGSFVTFGERFTLPDNFELRALVPDFPDAGSETSPRTANVNISIASELAASYIDNPSNLTVAAVTLANQRALGVVEFVTGLSSRGQAMGDITITDLTQATTTSTDVLGLALFGASLHGQVTSESSSLADYRRVLLQTSASIRPLASSATGQLRAQGNFLAQTLSAYLTTAITFQSGLAQPLPVLSGAIASQTNALPLLNLAGNNTIAISRPADPQSTDPVDRARVFVSRLSEAMGASLLVSNSSSFAGTATGAETVFADQQQLVRSLVSDELRQSFRQLDQAISDASANNETQISGTNVSGVLSFDGSTTTLTTATSSSSNIQTGISVNITIANGTRDGTGGSGTLNAADIAISIAQTQNDVTTQILYDGAITLNMIATNAGTDIDSLEYTGNLRSASALEFSGTVSATGLSRADITPITGQYSANFTFTSATNLSMDGRFESQIEQYSIGSGDNTVVADLITNQITDMTSILHLELNEQGAITGGSIVAAQAADAPAARVDDAGIVTYVDGTITALPAPII